MICVRAVVVSCALLAAGCTSSFKTSKFDANEWKPTGNAVEGIVYYEPRHVKLTYMFTALVKDGVLVGTADQGRCAKVVQKEEIVMEPNLAEPRVLLNSPGPLSTGKLSVTLANGMISTVNSESASRAPESIKEITTLLKESGLLPLAKAPTNGGTPACNASPVIDSKKPY